jgi:ATP/maltotriose-dependent transcriptional regulator MalT/DNA-binding SARP family transcriptional activator
VEHNVVQGARATKLLPPAVAPPALPRPRLEGRLDAGLARRLTVLIAGAGFGKSTLLSAWATTRATAWYTVASEDAELASLARGLVSALRLRVPALQVGVGAAIEGSRGPDGDLGELGSADAYAALICAALSAGRGRRDLVLVLDDLHELGADGASARLVESLVRNAPPTLHVVLASRDEPPFPIERLRGQGQVVELTARELAFTTDETRLLLEEALGETADDVAGDLQEASRGWPAAVRLALEALRDVSPEERRRTLEGLRRPGGRLFSYLAGEVFEREPEDVRALVRTVTPLDRFNAELCEALGVDNAADALASLERRGLFVESDRSEAGWYSLGALVREFARESMALSHEDQRALLTRAADWLAAQGFVEDALRALAAAGAHEELAALLAERGEAMLSAGGVDAVVRYTDLLPDAGLSTAVVLLAGRARQIRGEWEDALAWYARAAVSHELAPGLAWRIGLIHHHRGDLDEAVAVYERGRLDGESPRDEALLLAWHASLEWLRGDLDACKERAGRALQTATRIGDPQALGAAHTVMALIAAYEGDRVANDSHYMRALEYAERAGDVMQIIRIHTNRGSRRMEEADYEEALAELEIALRLADVAGFVFFRALALANRGSALLRLGRLEESIADLEAARSAYQAIGSRDVFYALLYLGDAYRERGDLALARAAYQEAAGRADEAGDLQALVPSLAGLARVVAGEDPGRAAALAERATGYGPGMAYVEALLAAADVALRSGNPGRAAALAADAAAEAGARRDRAGLAEALGLGAAAADDPARARAMAEEAVAVWRDIRSPIGEARTQLALARMLGTADGLALAETAEARLRELGVRGPVTSPASLLADDSEESAATVAIESLSRFRVLRDGAPVPLGEWQSKKARDLLKMLVARRGRPTPRDVFMEALWPEGDRAKVANRLSVALSTLRSVFDPGRRYEQDHFVSAGKDVLALETGSLEIDVERFLAEATAGLTLRAGGAPAAARVRLAAAEALYSGEFLEEDAYEDWAVPLREEARAAYISVARALGEDALERGEHDLAARYFLRTLEKDPYDEEVHLALVALHEEAGRHGQARRAYRTYVARMEEIAVEAAPFPSP